MRFAGVIPAIQTPFAEDGSIDHEILARSARRMLDGGMAGIVACGTMGEAQSLSAEERRSVIATVVEALDGKVDVTAGISAETPALAGRFARDAREAGATAVMALPSLGYGGDDDELVAWFQAIAAETDLPIMAYNNPKASGGTDMPAGLILRIADAVEQVVAIKECSGDARRIPEIVFAACGRLEVLVGGDDWALEGFASGATGWVSGVAVVAPAECRELYDRVQAQDLAGARRLYERLVPLARLDMTPKLVQYFKAGQDLLDLPGGGPVRAPRLPLDEAEQATLRAALERLGIGAFATA
jgi:dihydrodipicolinate synthase/N-acetylneuraminate lyase